MIKEGLPDNEIVGRMRASGTVYRLKASQWARLREQGVSDTVIDCMQGTYLAAVRRQQALTDEGDRTFGPDGYRYGGYPFGWPFYGDDEFHDFDRDQFAHGDFDRDHFSHREF